MNLLTYQDIAARWNVSVNTLRVWVHRGKMPQPDSRIGWSPVWYEETITNLEDENGQPM